MANLPSDYLTINAAGNSDPINSDFSCGWMFTPTQNIETSAIRFYCTQAITSLIGRIWGTSSDYPIIADTGAQSASTAGWLTMNLATPASLVSGTPYIVGVIQPEANGTAYYTVTSGISSATFGPVVTGVQAGSYNYAAGSDANQAPVRTSDASRGITDTWFGVDLVTSGDDGGGGNSPSSTGVWLRQSGSWISANVYRRASGVWQIANPVT